MTKPYAKTNPLEALAQLAASDQSHRATAKAANRLAMPICAEATDMVRAIYGEQNVQVRWLSEGGKEIGKAPVLEPHLFECSADAYIESQREQPVGRKFK